MPPAKAFCRQCNEQHSRPVGRNCRKNKVGDAAAMDVSVIEPAQQLLSAVPQINQNAVNTQILEKLSAISSQISSLDGRVTMAETALADRTTDLVPTSAVSVASNSLQASNNATATASASNATATAMTSNFSNVVPQSVNATNTSIIPTMDLLKSNQDIQKQVDARFAELHNSQASISSSGKLKSQRGGGVSDIPIKRFVPWPQHYMLVGPDKARPTYDQLNPIQFMSGCVKGALDLSEPDRTFALKYFSSLLEDASDFGFENAKACHAVVLTTMEQDKLAWSDTMELDRLRRQYAQRHSVPTNSQSGNANVGKKFSKSDSSTPENVICRFYNDSHCARSETHFTKGVWFLHICSKCRGNHKAKNCPGAKNQGSKN